MIPLIRIGYKDLEPIEITIVEVENLENYTGGTTSDSAPLKEGIPRFLFSIYFQTMATWRKDGLEQHLLQNN